MKDDKRVHLKIALADLQVKHDRLKKKNEELRKGIINDRDDVVCIRKDVYDTLKASHANLVEVLERIQVWQQAYPLKVFPKPDLKKARQVLKDAGMTLDAVSADNMRHVLDQIKSMVDLALKEAREI